MLQIWHPKVQHEPRLSFEISCSIPPAIRLAEQDSSCPRAMKKVRTSTVILPFPLISPPRKIGRSVMRYVPIIYKDGSCLFQTRCTLELQHDFLACL